MHSQSTDGHDKLIVLYLLDKSGVELSELQIVRIASELRILDYFSLKKALYFLVENEHIIEHSEGDHVSYAITEIGRQTLATLRGDIRLSVRDSIDDYLRGHRSALLNESRFRSFLQQDEEGRYSVRLEIFAEGHTVFSVTIEAANREDAQKMTRIWKDAAIPVYQSVLANLC